MSEHSPHPSGAVPISVKGWGFRGTETPLLKPRRAKHPKPKPGTENWLKTPEACRVMGVCYSTFVAGNMAPFRSRLRHERRGGNGRYAGVYYHPEDVALVRDVRAAVNLNLTDAVTVAVAIRDGRLTLPAARDGER